MSTTQINMIAELGRAISPELFKKTFAIFAADALRICRSPQAVRDIVYGAHERQRLNIFPQNSNADGKSPVVLFVHGGGFVGGDKGEEKAPFYNNVGAWAVVAGYVGATMNYRLAPDAPWPSGAEDVASAVAWLQENIARYGGDADNIFIFGQSAGAVHVADYVKLQRKASGTGAIAGAILVSGIYDLSRFRRTPFEHAYYGANLSGVDLGSRSTIDALVETDISCLFAMAEYDPPQFQGQILRLIEMYFDRNEIWPEFAFLPGQNHFSTVMQLGLSGDCLGPAICGFIQRAISKRASGA